MKNYFEKNFLVENKFFLFVIIQNFEKWKFLQVLSSLRDEVDNRN